MAVHSDFKVKINGGKIYIFPVKVCSFYFFAYKYDQPFILANKRILKKFFKVALIVNLTFKNVFQLGKKVLRV